MYDVPYKGQQRAFHDNVTRFCIQRFTNQGDSVVTLSAESDGVVECALELGRRVELFVASNGDAYEDVACRVESAWEGAWREGKFARDSSSSNFKSIGPDSLPAGIPMDTTPARVIREVGTNPSPQQLLEKATGVAANFGWNIKMSDSENVVCLHALDGQAYGSGSEDIPVWGKPVVFNTRQDALDWLNPEKDGVDLQFVRLVLVADYHLLKRMCVPAQEGVHSTEAGLYIEESPTCPASTPCGTRRPPTRHTRFAAIFGDPGHSTLW